MTGIYLNSFIIKPRDKCKYSQRDGHESKHGRFLRNSFVGDVNNAIAVL